MPAQNPDDFAILIGISSYPQTLPELPSAEHDVAQFSRWLLEVGGLPPENIRTVLSTPESTKENPIPVQLTVERAMERLQIGRCLSQGQRRGRRLYFYFSGHGLGNEFDDVAMLLADFSDFRQKGNIGLRGYRRMFRQAGTFDEVFYFLDCCRDHSRLAQAMDPGFTVLPPPTPRETRDVVVMAAPWGAQAFAAPVPGTPRHSSLLTRALLEGMGLDGTPMAIDPQGRVSTTTLWSYLRKRVPELAGALNRDQRPRVDDDAFDAPMYLATFPLDPQAAVAVTIALPASPATRFFIEMEKIDGMREIALQKDMPESAVASAWTVLLRPKFLYQVFDKDLHHVEFIDLRNQPPGSALAVTL